MNSIKLIKDGRFVLLSCLACLLLFFGTSLKEASAKEKIKWFNTLDQGLAEAKKTKKWVFVDIGAEWCGPCLRLKKNVLSTQTVQDFLSKNFVNVQLDADKEPVSALLKQHKVKAIPCLMIFTPKGTLKSKYEGAPKTAGEFVKKISSMIKGE